jgi:hypothetical protein
MSMNEIETLSTDSVPSKVLTDWIRKPRLGYFVGPNKVLALPEYYYPEVIIRPFERLSAT